MVRVIRVGAVEVSWFELAVIFSMILYLVLQPLGMNITDGDRITVTFKNSDGSPIANALCYCHPGMSTASCDPYSDRTNSNGRVVFTWRGASISSPRIEVGCFCPGTNDKAEFEGRLSLTHQVSITKQCAGSEPADGEMKCSGNNPYRYSQAEHTFLRSETCGSERTCTCTDSTRCFCKTSGCVPGWGCKSGSSKGYKNSDCSWTQVSSCFTPTPYCLNGVCVECRSDGDCNDFIPYTRDNCVSHSCVNTVLTTTTRATTTTTTRATTTTTFHATTTTQPTAHGYETTTSTTPTTTRTLPPEIAPYFPPVSHDNSVWVEPEPSAPPAKELKATDYLILAVAAFVILIVLALILKKKKPQTPRFILPEALMRIDTLPKEED